MPYTWVRNISSGQGWHTGVALLCSIPNGDTYRRVRFSWGFVGHTSSIVAMQPMCGNMIIMGLVTTIGNGGEHVPNAFSESGDAAPPTERWIWWETRAAVPTAIDQAAGLITWRDTGPQEPPDAKVNVLATGIPGGDTLNLWASWTASNWDDSGDVEVWLGASILFSSP